MRRKRWARRLVIFVSGFLDRAYRCNCNGHRRREEAWAWGYRRVQRPVLWIARQLNYSAAVDQMIVECWWG